LYTNDDEPAVQRLALEANRSIISFTRLPNGEAFVVAWHHQDGWAGENFTVPGALFPDREYVISTHDPGNTGRPARLTMYLPPTAQHPTMIADEYGAYHVPLGTQFSTPMGKLTRTKVLKSKVKP
jgi:hypothetical protein